MMGGKKVVWMENQTVAVRVDSAVDMLVAEMAEQLADTKVEKSADEKAAL